MLPPSAEDPRAPSSQLRSGSTAKAKDPSGKAVEPSLAVMPITVWSPSTQSVEPPPSRAEELGRKRPEADVDGDSLLFNAELVSSTISSILRDFDLKRSGALPVEEALALSLQGVISVSSRVFMCLPLSLVLSCALTLCWVSAGGYPSEEFGKKGQTERGSRQSRQSLQGESGCSYL